MIIFGPHLTTFELSNILGGSWGSQKLVQVINQTIEFNLFTPDTNGKFAIQKQTNVKTQNCFSKISVKTFQTSKAINYFMTQSSSFTFTGTVSLSFN